MELQLPRIRTATAIRKLKRRARDIAESEAPQVVGSTSKRKAVRSAFVSRQTGRHYARLLAEHVSNLELERDQTIESIKKTAADVRLLRQMLAWNTSITAEEPQTSFLDDIIEGKYSLLLNDE